MAITTTAWETSELAITADGVVGKTVVGQLLAGKKLVIQSDRGDFFYLGNLKDHIPNNDGNDFGLQIKDEEGTEERIFLGIESGKAILRLRSANGNHELVITENGIINVNEWMYGNNISPEEDCEMILPIKVDEGTSEMRKCVLTLIRQKYKTYSRGVEAGGAILTAVTTEGGGSYVNTTGGGGGISVSRSSENNTVMTDLYGASTDNATPSGIGSALISAINSGDGTMVSTLLDGHKHPMDHFGLVHAHMFEVQLDPHSHGISIPSHVHPFQLSVPPHEHPQIIGVQPVNSYCSNIKVEVNGQIVKTGINSDGEIDITQYIELNKTNLVKLYSSTHGFLYVHVYEKRFVSY